MPLHRKTETARSSSSQPHCTPILSCVALRAKLTPLLNGYRNYQLFSALRGPSQEPMNSRLRRPTQFLSSLTLFYYPARSVTSSIHRNECLQRTARCPTDMQSAPQSPSLQNGE